MKNDEMGMEMEIYWRERERESRNSNMDLYVVFFGKCQQQFIQLHNEFKRSTVQLKD